jgi:4-diphosphocytidyl-2C-methyl-D-erythritol kinase
MPAARVAAQGKINLSLRILAREASGFHDLETLFCRIALADDVIVRVGDSTDRELSITGEAVPPEGLGAHRRPTLPGAPPRPTPTSTTGRAASRSRSTK